MKDITRLLCMVLLSFLVVTGCSRRDILDDYPVSGGSAAGLERSDGEVAGRSSDYFLSERRKR